MTTTRLPIPIRDETTSEPLLVMFHRWYLENRQAIYDLGVMLVLASLTFIVFITYEFTELFFDFTRRYEEIELDEILLTLLVILAIYTPAFTIRRWMESVRYLRQSNTDSLTKLANRRRGWEILNAEIARATRYKSELSILMIDIDFFKAINDRHGHLRGDRFLEDFAKALQGRIRENDTLVRWGGEEFMLVSAATDKAGARQLAQRLRLYIEDRHFRDSINVTASFGVAQWRPEDTVESLIQRADERLYEAKRSGRNRVE